MLFADDSKIISVIKGEMGIDKLQNDLFTVGGWCKTLGIIKSESSLQHD